jgi:hypothetical protein
MEHTNRETLTCVTWIEGHGLKALVLFQHRAGPLPDSTHLGLSGKLVSEMRNWHRMPVAEADVGSKQVYEQVVRVWTCSRARQTSL